MDKQRFTAGATDALARFGTLAHQAIDLYREGGERFGVLASERWDAAFEQSKSQLDAQTRKNAKHFKDVVGNYWSRAVTLSADGAQVAVDTLVGAAIAGVERAAANKAA